MTKIIILPFLCLLISISAAPTREAFALEERTITGVPSMPMDACGPRRGLITKEE